MNRIFQGAKYDIKAINLNKFYSAVQDELGIKKSSMLELGVEERVHHVDRTRTVTTTQIAAGHEFGNTFVQPRPFLHNSANEFVNGDFSKDVKQDYTYLGAFLKRLAKKLYGTVVECFMSGGFGTWLPLKDRYKLRTGRFDPPLLDTGKLLSSVYVRYEGFTVSGKRTGGTVSSDMSQDKLNREINEERRKLTIKYVSKIGAKEFKKNRLKFREQIYNEAVEQWWEKYNRKK